MNADTKAFWRAWLGHIKSASTSALFVIIMPIIWLLGELTLLLTNGAIRIVPPPRKLHPKKQPWEMPEARN